MKTTIQYDFPRPGSGADPQECNISSSTSDGNMPNPMFFVAVMFATAKLISSRVECKCDTCSSAARLCDEVAPKLAAIMGNVSIMEDTIGPTAGRA